MGFANTQAKNGQIKSLQVLYYSEDQTTCSCLASRPDKTNVKTWLREPYAGDNWLVLMINDGSLLPYFVGTLGLIVLILVTVLIGGLYFSYRACCYPPRVIAKPEAKYSELIDELRKKEARF